MNYIKLFFIMTLLSLVLVASEEQPTEQEVAKLYVATFNRAPDSGGLKYWTTDSGLKLSKISQSFFDQPETQSLYPPSTSNRDFIASVYQNLFNRKPETSGWDYWETQLNVGAFNKNRFIEAVINGAQGDDAVILENKTEVGIAFADAGLNNMDKAKEVMSGITANQESVTTALESISNNDSSTKKGLGLILDPPKVTETLYAATPPTLYASGDLPESYDLSKDMPPVRSQGGQGSCVSWAVGYYIKGYHEHIESGIEYGKGNDYTGVHSPAFLFNIVKISCSGGSYFSDNLERLRDIGISSWEDMPYNQYDCESLPSQEAIENAKCSKIVNYKWLPLSSPVESIQLEDIKYYLNQNKPILIGIPVYNRFYSPERYMEKIDGEYIYQKYNKNEKSDGNHAIVVVGYDNHKNAFKIVNSWGADWGNKGYLWIDYEVFKNICFVAYVTTDAKNSCDEGSAYLSINKASLVFGDKPINESYSEEFTISNTGTADVYISNITVPNGYSVNWTNETISAGMKKSVIVTFRPTEKKQYNGTLLVEHNAENGNDRVNLVGAGVDKDNPNQPPIANAGADVNADEGDVVQLDASGSSDLDGSIVSYQWKEGNTIIGNNKILQKSDFSEGVHRITLTVTDDDGVTSTDTVVVTINPNNQSPIANAGSDKSIKIGKSITITGSGTDSDGTITSYKWKKGSTTLATSATFTYTPTSVGTDTLTLIVTDDDGAVSSDTVVITINTNNQAPVANAGVDVNANVGDIVRLDASSSFDSDGSIVSYEWKEGSTFISNSQTFQKSDFSEGMHEITLTVTDDDGATSTDTVVVTTTSIPKNMSVEKIGEYKGKNYISIEVEGDYAYILTEEGLKILNIKDNDDVHSISELVLDGYKEKIIKNNNYLYIANSDKGLRIVDISNIKQPKIIGTFYTGTDDWSGWVHDVDVQGDYAFVAYNGGGALNIVNIKDKTAPKLVSNYTDAGMMTVKVKGEYIYAESFGGARGLSILKFNNDNEPLFIGRYDEDSLSAFIRDIEVEGNYAYVLVNNIGVRVIDISDKVNPTLIYTIEIYDNHKALELYNQYLFVTSSNHEGTKIIDISYKTNPKILAKFHPYGLGSEMKFQDNKLYVIGESEGLKIFTTTPKL